MKPGPQKGQLTTWKDDQGFGFIKPDHGGKDVFLHISALKGAGRRPRVGDTILYEQVTEANGKIRAAGASIQGIAPQRLTNPGIAAQSNTARTSQRFVPQPLATKRNNREGGLIKTVGSVVTLAAIALTAMQLGRGRFPWPITSPLITSKSQSECVIKGNISIETGNKLYHLPGMEDYQSTNIDPGRGERWFCSEQEAIANGWRKAPK